MSYTSIKLHSTATKLSIDLNCDMGESFGAYTIGNDAELIKYASSVNIACGFHGGDPRVMRSTVELALEYRVAIGAHPGLPDKEGFGRRKMQVSPEEVYDMTLYQISALDGVTRASGGIMTHVKPHGALYNMLAEPNNHAAELSAACVEAIKKLNPMLMFVGLANSTMIRVAEKIGLRAVSEAFADRTYLANGLLTPRSEKNSVITSDKEAAEQAVSIATHHLARTADNNQVPVNAQTICLHGDSPHAVQFARAVTEELKLVGVEICALQH